MQRSSVPEPEVRVFFNALSCLCRFLSFVNVQELCLWQIKEVSVAGGLRSVFEAVSERGVSGTGVSEVVLLVECPVFWKLFCLAFEE